VDITIFYNCHVIQQNENGKSRLDKAILKSGKTYMYKLIILLIITSPLFATDITINTSAGRKPISPYIYGKNNSLSDRPENPLSQEDWQFLRDAGVKMFRETGGNNSTKYNWRRKLSSHPDWYNNVYDHDWDYVAGSLQDNIPGAAGLFAFQILGKVAANKDHNFNDWDYNQSQWWEGVRNNWAGGGGPDAGDGNPDLYLINWPDDSTVAILDHWFGTSGLGLDRDKFQYWNMDNEPEIWSGTHDDVMPQQFPVEAFILKYASVAKKARAKYPDIKLVGPVFANEWQWYNWNNAKISAGGKSYTLLEYFIKRIAELQKSSGVRLLDVLTLHFYPTESNSEQIVQLHRVWFDRSYQYPGANGVRRAGDGEWDETINEEYIFERCRDWLDEYMGPDHGVTYGVTEMGINGENPNVTAVWYASTLGVFAKETVEVFTPWDWRTGMWEVLHMFSRYNKDTHVESVSDNDSLVSAYSSINAMADSMTIVLVNRDITLNKDATIHLNNFSITDGTYEYLMLNDLPESETFKSHIDNALQTGTVTVSNGSFTISLPKLSVTSIILTGKGEATGIEKIPIRMDLALTVYPNPFNPTTTIYYHLPNPENVKIDLYDLRGRHVKTISNIRRQSAGSHEYYFNGNNLASGIYFLKFTAGASTLQKKIMLVR